MQLILAVLVLGAAVTDLTTGKIYNSFLLPVFLAGLLLRIDFAGVQILPEILASIGITAVILLPFWFLHGIGAGDIKLLAVVSSFLLPEDAFHCFSASFLIGACFALLRYRKTHNRKSSIHFALPVCIGVLAHVGGLI